MELSLEKQYEIVFLREHPAGPKFSFGFIAKQVRCSKSTAIYWVKRYYENRDLSTSERPGRPCVTSAKQDDKIVKMAEKEHNITAIQIQEKMEERGVGLSVETVRRRLRKSRGKFSNEISKPLLKEDHRKKGCNGQKNIRILIGIIDESTFQLYISKKGLAVSW
jgi:transposase